MIKNESTEVNLPEYLYDFELLKQTRLLQISLEEKEAASPLTSFRRAKFLKKNNVFDEYQKFIYASRYSRWNEKEQRREFWEETVKR